MSKIAFAGILLALQGLQSHGPLEYRYDMEQDTLCLYHVYPYQHCPVGRKKPQVDLECLAAVDKLKDKYPNVNMYRFCIQDDE